MCASWPTTLASLTRPGLQRAQMLGILGDAKVITVPIALTHVCLPNLWSQGRLTHCNSALFAQSVKSDLGCPGEGPPGGSAGRKSGVRTGMKLVFSFGHFTLFWLSFHKGQGQSFPGNSRPSNQREQARVWQPRLLVGFQVPSTSPGPQAKTEHS